MINRYLSVLIASLMLFNLSFCSVTEVRESLIRVKSSDNSENTDFSHSDKLAIISTVLARELILIDGSTEQDQNPLLGFLYYPELVS